MKACHRLAIVFGAAFPLLTGCNLPGRPKPEPEVPRPEAVLSFDTLYGQNCAGCHGANGQNGAATNLANPEYQALVDDASLRGVIANGEKGTLMPGFSIHSGGDLTDAQIDVIVRGMRTRWGGSNPIAGQNVPPYKASHPGNVANGQAVYSQACVRCHGTTAQRRGEAGSILDGSFLALVNEQTIRTTIIAGRPDIGEPDWRGHIPGRPMTDDEITDVSAWLISQRPATPGQPYPGTAPASVSSAERPAGLGKKGVQ
jgi:cytochrome c oxidase cbb3-type subunit 3/ubiquinol-cytochrome c reductase cytochrome c subunit